MALRKPSGKIDTRNLEHVIAMRITATLRDLEFLISATPTSEVRNAFTDANLHMMQARDAFDKARAESDRARYA